MGGSCGGEQQWDDEESSGVRLARAVKARAPHKYPELVRIAQALALDSKRRPLSKQ